MTDVANNSAGAETATAGAEAAVVNENVLMCKILDTGNELAIDLAQVAPVIRLAFLKQAIRDNVRNRLNAVQIRFNKANEAWSAYDKAQEADATQTAVTKPEGERPTLDLIEPAKRAREDLYAGTLRGLGEKKERVTVDPLVKLVTEAVVRDVFAKGKEAGTADWTFFKARGEVGKDGVAYLDARIAEHVANGGDAAALNKMKEDKYMKPARIMLGIDQSKAVKEGPSIL